MPAYQRIDLSHLPWPTKQTLARRAPTWMLCTAALCSLAACVDDGLGAGEAPTAAAADPAAAVSPPWFSTRETEAGYHLKAQAPSDVVGHDWYLVAPDRAPLYLGASQAGERIVELSLARSQVPAGEFWLEASPHTGDAAPLDSDRDIAALTGGVITQATDTDVGVIPAALSCPASSEFIRISMDNEDSRPASSMSGWTGGITLDSNRNTHFRFCRVAGTSFASLSSSSSNGTNYAVLRLGMHCPPGSVPFSRSFDNEDSGTANSFQGTIFPNTVTNNTNMMFCLFRGDGALISKLPGLGFSYGVFAAPQFSPVAQRGSVFTDDEDDNNANGYVADISWQAAAQAIVVPGSNTTLFTARAVMCGDSLCSSGENVSSCFSDCDVCGNGVCRANENAFSCPPDCVVCGDGICSPGESCTLDCAQDPCLSSPGVIAPPECIAGQVSVR